MVAVVIFGIIPLAMLFWLVEVVRAKVAGRPPSWEQPHEPPPANSLGRAMWANPSPRPPATAPEDDGARPS